MPTNMLGNEWSNLWRKEGKDWAGLSGRWAIPFRGGSLCSSCIFFIYVIMLSKYDRTREQRDGDSYNTPCFCSLSYKYDRTGIRIRRLRSPLLLSDPIRSDKNLSILLSAILLTPSYLPSSYLPYSSLLLIFLSPSYLPSSYLSAGGLDQFYCLG